MAPRGLSAEEKRVRLIELFHETKDFFQLKELEKLGPKMKGIVSQSVKDVLQGLVDDGLVQYDKIGASNFFWSFPSERGTIMNNRLDAVKTENKKLRDQLADVNAALETERRARPDNAERNAALAELASLKDQLKVLEDELAKYGSCDPIKIEAKRRASELAHEATVRWTDNASILISHMVRQLGAASDELRAYAGLPDDFEDI